MKNTIQSTSDSLTLPAPASVRSGDLVVAGDLAGVAVADASAGALCVLSLVGIYSLPKASGVAVTLGQKLYGIAADKTVTNVPGAAPGLPLVGFAAAPAAATDGMVAVLLSRGG